MSFAPKLHYTINADAEPKTKVVSAVSAGPQILASDSESKVVDGLVTVRADQGFAARNGLLHVQAADRTMVVKALKNFSKFANDFIAFAKTGAEASLAAAIQNVTGAHLSTDEQFTASDVQLYYANDADSNVPVLSLKLAGDAAPVFVYFKDALYSCALAEPVIVYELKVDTEPKQKIATGVRAGTPVLTAAAIAEKKDLNDAVWTIHSDDAELFAAANNLVKVDIDMDKKVVGKVLKTANEVATELLALTDSSRAAKVTAAIQEFSSKYLASDEQCKSASLYYANGANSCVPVFHVPLSADAAPVFCVLKDLLVKAE